MNCQNSTPYLVYTLSRGPRLPGGLFTMKVIVLRLVGAPFAVTLNQQSLKRSSNLLSLAQSTPIRAPCQIIPWKQLAIRIPTIDNSAQGFVAIRRTKHGRSQGADAGNDNLAIDDSINVMAHESHELDIKFDHKV